MINRYGNKNMWFGVVEDRMDPLYLGRCRVRIVGLHTSNKQELPTADLPWAFPLQPITSAAMNGIGQTALGAVEGTWVILTFNDDEYQQPFMIGSIGGIPFAADVQQDEIQDFLFSSGTQPQTKRDPTIVGTGSGGIVTDSSGNPVTAPNTATDNSQDLSKIPTVPPPDWQGDRSSASKGIQAIISACKNGGIINRNAVASILGIVGGESGWIPQDEAYNYSASRLKQIFKSTTPEQIEKYSRAKTKGMSRKEFFSFFYGPTFRGKNFLGNKNDEDGGTFYGRGLLQLTGRTNYTKYGTAAKRDIVSNPELLNSDIDVSAKVTVAYFIDRTPVDQGNSRYFDAALIAVGHNSPDISKKKREYYEYFLGGEQPKNGDEPLPTPSEETLKKTEPPKMPEPKDNTDSGQVGFSDPNKKYPIKSYLKEPDTHRLARRQKIGSTIHKEKETGRTKEITVANSDVKWDQNNLPYNGRYPYDHVYQSESGHTMEFDDTQEAERVHLYHRKGTFLEIDSEGNRVDKVVGEMTTVVDEDSLICISGAHHTHIGQDNSVLVGGQMQMQVFGNVTLVINGNVYQTVSGNTNMTTGGNFNIRAGGSVNIKAGGNINEDGSQIHLNGGTSSSPDVAPSYAPNIMQPKPVTLDEAAFIEIMEDNPERRKQIESDNFPDGKAPVVEKKDEAVPEKQKETVPTICDFPGNLVYTTRLSDNYTLGDLCFKQGREFPFGVGQVGLSDKEIACNLKHLCVNILEPLRLKYKDIGFKLNSAFRLNTSRKVSPHDMGQAADVSFASLRSGPYEQQLEAFYQKAIEIRDSGLPYDQLIFESDPAQKWVWIHISFRLTPRAITDRTKVMSWIAGNGRGYVPGIHKVVL